MGIFTFYEAIFSKSVHYLLSQILTFNQWIRIIRLLGCYQANEISINKINLCNAEETQKVHLKWHLDAFTHCLMQDMNAFNLQLQMHKSCFDILNTKR